MVTDDSDRRLTALEARLEAIDREGTRGTQALQAQVGTVQRDVGRLETGQGRLELSLQTIQLQLAARPGRGAWLRDLATLLPLYILVIDLIARGVH